MSIAPDEIPKRIGRYVIEVSVGYGAMGAVYRALDPLISRTVAIKTIRLDVPPASPHYQSFLRRFYTEAKASGALSHPNIVTVYDIGETEDKIPFLAMEFVDGDTVSDLLEMGEKLRPEQVVALVSQMADAIDYAHTKGVIHRDIKPSNIIVYDGEKVKITDFGIAKLMDAEGTQTASLLGTPSYMSPEQAMGEQLDGRTDIFSLGVVAFEMLSGQQPFPGNNVTSILYKLVHSDPVQPENLEVLGLLSDKWQKVFSKALSKNPSERYGVAADFVADLERCLDSWFGALEGETVMMSASEASQLVEEGSDGPPTSGEKEEAEAEEGDETVLLNSSELPSASSSLSQSPSQTRPPFEEEEQETVALRSELEAVTESHPVGMTEETLAVEETLTEPPPLASMEDERETVALNVEDAAAVTVAMPGMSHPPPAAEPSETVVSGADSVTTGRASVPKELTSARTKKDKRPVPLKYLMAALAALLVMLACVVAVRVIGVGEPEIPPDPAMPSPEPGVLVDGMLKVSSDPDGATVLLDGEVIGVTPMERVPLGLDVYMVRLEKDGYETQELVADLRSGSPQVHLDVTLQKPTIPAPPAPKRAFINVTSTPSGASVLIDGKSVGATPVERFRAQPGSRSVVVQMEGYQSWETSVDLLAGASETIEAGLEPIEVAPPPEPEPPETQFGALVERGPDVVDPKCIECPNPPYPPAALRAKIQGVVGLSFLVTETGAVKEIQVTESGGELFDQSVIDVVKDWKFEPATKSGVPVKVRLSRRFRYRRGR